MDLHKFTNEIVKLRCSKVNARNSFKKLVKLPGDKLLLLSDDNCLRTLIFDEIKSSKTKDIGFLCPYCPSIFQSLIHLTNQHFEVHMGPKICETCKVCRLTLFKH